ncbi:uncharacterized protein LOC126795363 [Argentina anserina]|uniref:uncharacterized protein LOC126795363 n=1 Tax=Argentina anserina TaxID=57926 RepID=UPI002176867F|nr:uncharacterized protein LOC126795363 [Potentilla anserina]
MYGLSQDYWHSRHLMEIARGVGTPLQLDKATKEREFGYNACMLLDVDLANELPSSLMVEREEYCFPIEIVYENMCTHCVIAQVDQGMNFESRDTDEKITIEDNGRDIDEGKTIKNDRVLVPRPCTPTSSENQFVILAQEAIVGAANELIEKLANQVFHGLNAQTLDVENSMVVTNEALDDVESSFPTSSTRTEENAIVV